MVKSKVKAQHYRSSVKGRKPAAADMDYGELAINYNHEEPKLFIKGDDNNLIEFGVASSAPTPEFLAMVDPSAAEAAAVLAKAKNGSVIQISPKEDGFTGPVHATVQGFEAADFTTWPSLAHFIFDGTKWHRMLQGYTGAAKGRVLGYAYDSVDDGIPFKQYALQVRGEDPASVYNNGNRRDVDASDVILADGTSWMIFDPTGLQTAIRSAASQADWDAYFTAQSASWGALIADAGPPGKVERNQRIGFVDPALSYKGVQNISRPAGGRPLGRSSGDLIWIEATNNPGRGWEAIYPVDACSKLYPGTVLPNVAPTPGSFLYHNGNEYIEIVTRQSYNFNPQIHSVPKKDFDHTNVALHFAVHPVKQGDIVNVKYEDRNNASHFYMIKSKNTGFNKADLIANEIATVIHELPDLP